MIDINQVVFGYHKKQTVLEGLNLNLKPGNIYGLLGRNGVGKSTLLHHICGLLFPTHGTCTVLGEKPENRNPLFLQKVFLLPEDFYLPNITITQYVKAYASFYPEFSQALFDQFLIEFEIPLANKLQGMSFGQRKKVMISFALATQAKILLMDEPTNGLDIPSKKQFRKIIAGHVKDDQIIIISTHQVKDLDSLIDAVLVLEDKKIIINQTVENITEKLSFKQVMNMDEVQSPIYSEGGLKGYVVVAVNHHKENTRMDMELFFNAILSEKQQIVSLFN